MWVLVGSTSEGDRCFGRPPYYYLPNSLHHKALQMPGGLTLTVVTLMGGLVVLTLVTRKSSGAHFRPLCVAGRYRRCRLTFISHYSLVAASAASRLKAETMRCSV